VAQGHQPNSSDGVRSFAVPISLLVPLVLAILGGIVVYSSRAYLPFPVYYGLAAQIIPILMIAFALESRATDLLSDPQMRFYRIQLFLFLLVGEVFALLGASGALRGEVTAGEIKQGYVADDFATSNLIAAGTTVGLVGGFAMLAVLALFWGPGWVFFSFRKRPSDQELVELREQVRNLERQVEDSP
jgi:hypothetical protein